MLDVNRELLWKQEKLYKMAQEVQVLEQKAKGMASFIDSVKAEHGITYNTRLPVEKPKHSKGIGICQAVKLFREQNPTATKVDACKYLIATHFDFRGQDKQKTVNMAWVYLDYSGER